MKRKLIALLSCFLCACFCFGACAGGETPDPTPGPTPGPTPTPSDVGTVYGTTDTAFTAMTAPSGQTAESAYTAAAYDGKVAAGTDAVRCFTAPQDGLYTVSFTGVAVTGGAAALTVCQNAKTVWPLDGVPMALATGASADGVTFATAVKKGEKLYIRLASDGGEAAAAFAPSVTYTAATYEAAKDLSVTPAVLTPVAVAGSTMEKDLFPVAPRRESAPMNVSWAKLQPAVTGDAQGDLVEGGFYAVANSGPITMDFSDLTADLRIPCTVVCQADVTVTGLPSDVCIEAFGIRTPGKITFDNCAGTFYNGYFDGAQTVVSDTSAALRLEHCRFESPDVALSVEADGVTVVDCYLSGRIGAYAGNVTDALFENCVIRGTAFAVDLIGTADTTVWYSDIAGNVYGGEDAVNLMVAACRFANGGRVVYNGTHNCVAVLNELDNVDVLNSTNSYVCSNRIAGGLSFRNVRYMIATRNEMLTESAVLTDTAEYNGDNVTDVDARAEYGVNADLLPHLNPDQHIGMTRRAAVRTANRDALEGAAYLNKYAKTGTTLIIAPGAYATHASVSLSSVNDADIYAYGALFERDTYQNVMFQLSECKNISFRGLTTDTTYNACGHLIVVEKDDARGICYGVSAAGMHPDWSDDAYYTMHGDFGCLMYHNGDEYPFADLTPSNVVYDPATGISRMTYSSAAMAVIEIGDFVVCRGNGGNVANIFGCTSPLFEDFTVYSGAIRCFWDSTAEAGTILNRVSDVPAPAKVITRAMYEQYKAYEEKYDVNTFVYIDEDGNYRGTPARCVTADSTHSSNSRTGMTVTSCKFSGLSDDGTNHQGFHGRLSAYDPATGTITYKKNTCTLGYTNVCYPFVAGDRVYVYTSDGRLMCDTPALDVTKTSGDTYSVRVDPAAFDATHLSDYNLASTVPGDPKVMIDNMDRNGNGFHFENVLIQNIRSRGCLVKCSDPTIDHCTIRNIGMAAIGLIFEIEWGESGISANATITNNYIEHTGYYTNRNIYSPITISGLGNTVDEEHLPYENILIQNNHIVDRATDSALYINSAKDVRVLDNDFGECFDPRSEEFRDTPAVRIESAMNIEFSRNTYSREFPDHTPDEYMLLSGYVNVYGTDLGNEGGNDPIASAAHVSSSSNYPAHVSGTAVSYSGPWRCGALPLAALTALTPYRTVVGGCWYSLDDNIWSTSGGIGDQSRSFRFVASGTNNSAYEYTAEKTGKAKFLLNGVVLPPAAGDGSGSSYFAIFVDGEMVFPKEGGSYSSTSDWYPISSDMSEAELARALKNVECDVEAGQKIYFVSRRVSAWSSFGCQPTVYYTEVEE